MDHRVLVVDDDPMMLKLVSRHLTAAGYSVITAENGVEALRILHIDGPALVITDYDMPRLNGVELCRAIRSSEGIGVIYIVMLTAMSEDEHLVESFEAGADDFLSKPVTRQELLARLKAGSRIVELERSLAERHMAMHKANAELAVLNNKLDAMATTDELTNLPNRREAIRYLHDGWAMSDRQSTSLGCLILDIDNFKSFNDTYGHAVGDAILRHTAGMMRMGLRKGERLARLGGEEFLLMCPCATLDGLRSTAERFRRIVAESVFCHGGSEVRLTISIGGAMRSVSTASAEAMLKKADEALYSAKNSGRDTSIICMGTDDLPTCSATSEQ
jgi:diguanylate cyclase (GGDEF)-like protein